MSNKTSWGLALALGLFIATTGVWLPLGQLYLLNTTNLTLPFSAHLVQLAMLGGVVAACVVILQVVVPSRIRRHVSAALLAVGIFLWAESTLFIGNFGFLSGGDLDWSANRHLLFLEILLAGALLVVLIRFRGFLLRWAGLIMGLLVISSAANLLGPLQANRSRTHIEVAHTFTQEELFQLSADRNVLLFIVDTFQSDIFAEITGENPRWRQVLDGFTYFPDATCAFPKTYASIPSILTGQSFDNSQPFSRYLSQAYLGNSAPRLLKSRGFDVRFHSFTWQPYFPHPDVADNLARTGAGPQDRWVRRREFTQLQNLLMFRLAPFAAKPWVFNDNRFRLQFQPVPDGSPADPYPLPEEKRVFSAGNQVEDLEFLDRALAYLTADAKQPTFRVYHLEGAHAPFHLDPDLNYVGPQEYARGPFLDQSEAMLKLLEVFFTRLQELDAYDNSLILVVSDHGNGEMESLGIRPESLRAWGKNPAPMVYDDPQKLEVIRGGLPLVMVKAPGARGELDLSDAPVELADIPATIFEVLGLETHGTGRSFLAENFDPQRKRLHRFYRFAGWGQDFIVPMTEYAVSGFSWDPASWAPSGHDLNRAAVSAAQGPMVILGDGGNLEDFKPAGWGPPQVQGRFIPDRSASFVFSLPQDVASALLEVTIKHFPLQPPAPMHVFVSDELAAVWTVGGLAPEDFEIFLPDKTLIPGSEIEVRFQLDPDMDPGPQIVEAHLDFQQKWARCPLDRTISFAQGSEGEAFLGYGWFPSESWGTWSEGYISTLNMGLDPVPDGDLVLDITALPALFAASPPLRVHVHANGALIGTLELAQPGSQVHRFPVAAALIPTSGHLDLTFSVENPRSPAEFGQGNDLRALGLGLESLLIRRLASANPAPVQEQEIPPPSFSLNLTPSAGIGQWSGVHATEMWDGQAVAWTQEQAACRFSWNHGVGPSRLLVNIIQTAPGGTPLTISLNGEAILTESSVTGPWSRIVELPDGPWRGPLELRLTSNTFVPGSPEDSGDPRILGVALKEMILER